MDDIDSGKPRIRMYADDHGKFKGEALVCKSRRLIQMA